jgi:apolipoprotein N-acyltransferase
MFHSSHKWFGSGFLIGILWFYWIAFSLKYYGFWFLIPFVVFLIGLIYGWLFWAIGYFYKKMPKYLDAIYIAFVFTFLFDYFAPFSFDWLKPDILFVNSYFGIKKWQIFLVLLAIAFFKYFKLSIFLIFLAINFFKPQVYKMPSIKLVFTNISQDKKWDIKYIPYEIEQNFKYIDDAIGKYKIIVLPESAFPIFLNEYPNLVNNLKKLSFKIAIITGALHYKNGKIFNSTYVFNNGKVQIIDKHILVPFGEYVPYFSKIVNKIFFNGASDYSASKDFSTFKIGNFNFINAICYEATIEDLYKLKPKYIIAISNNAWFIPIEWSIQQLLIKLYAKRYKKVVFHAINGGKSYVLK